MQRGRSSWTAFGHGLADTGGKIGTPPRPQEMEGTRGCLAGAPTMRSSIFARQATVDLSGKDEHSTKRSKRKREPSQDDEPMNRARERTERMWHPLPPEWEIGAEFEFFHNTLHRVYEGPPDGTPRVRLSPEEIFVDFEKTYTILSVFANKTFTSVEFMAEEFDPEVSVLHASGYRNVWTNVRRGGIWWAGIVASKAACILREKKKKSEQ